MTSRVCMISAVMDMDLLEILLVDPNRSLTCKQFLIVCV